MNRRRRTYPYPPHLAEKFPIYNIVVVVVIVIVIIINNIINININISSIIRDQNGKKLAKPSALLLTISTSSEIYTLFTHSTCFHSPLASRCVGLDALADMQRVNKHTARCNHMDSEPQYFRLPAEAHTWLTCRFTNLV